MRKTSYGLLLLLGCIGSKPSFEQMPVELIQEESAIGTKENPQARAAFEIAQIRNPTTQEIPPNIRQKELAFSAKHKSRAQLSAQRAEAAQLENWQLAGPFNVGGRTRALAIDVTNENVIIAGGVSGGIWKSVNGGSTWYRTSDPEFTNSVSTVVQDTRPGKEHIWYFGTGELVGNSARGGGAPYRGDGIFKSTDGGESWFPLSNTQEVSTSLFGSQFQYTWRIVTDPSDLNNDVVLVAAFGGILRSQDGGETWTSVLGEALFDLPEDVDLNEVEAPYFTDIVRAPNGHFYAYISRYSIQDSPYEDGGMYWSQDGIIWHNLTIPLSTTFTRAVMDATATKAYFFVSFNDQSYLYRYNFNGISGGGAPLGTWTTLSANLPQFDGLGNLDIQTGYNMMLKVHPTDPVIMYLGGTNLYRSTDAFTSPNNIQWIGGYSDEDNGSEYENHHPDQHDLVFYSSNPNRMLSANDGGVHRTNDGTAASVSWTSLNNGYVTSQFYTVAIPKEESSNVIIGGLQDNGSWMNISNQTNAVWYSIIGGDGAYTATVPKGLYWYFSFQNGQIYRLTLNDNLALTSFARVDPTGGGERTGGSYLFINPYVLDPQNPNVMYLAGGNAIWKNSNLAQIPTGSQETTLVNWKLLLQTAVTSGPITALEVSSNSEYLYYGTGVGELFRLHAPASHGAGEKVNIKQANLPEDAYVSAIASNPEDDDEVLVVFSNYGIPSLFHSNDAGDSFVDVSGNLEEFADGTGNGPSVRWAEIVPLENGTRYFVGTSVGLYSTDQLNGAATVWLKESADLIGKSVVKMMDYRPLDGTLVVATHGNGVFRTKLQGFKAIPPSTENAPEKFSASRAYPNPFQTRTQIEFDIPETNYLQVDIYDLNGRIIRNLFVGPQFAGTSVVTWDGTDQHGQTVKEGLYIYRINYDGKIGIGKIMYDR